MKRFLTACLLLAWATSATAATVYDTITGKPTTTVALLIQPTSTMAMVFQSGGTGTVASVDVDVSNVFATQTANLRFGFFADGTTAPGAMLGDWVSVSVATDGLKTLTGFGAGAALSSGQTYWLVGEHVSGAVGVWKQNTVANAGPSNLWFDQGGGWDESTGELRAIVTVTPPAVPLPAGAPLLLAGLAAFAVLRRRAARA